MSELFRKCRVLTILLYCDLFFQLTLQGFKIAQYLGTLTGFGDFSDNRERKGEMEDFAEEYLVRRGQSTVID